MCRKVALVQVVVLRFVALQSAVEAHAWHHAEGIVACGVAIVGAFRHPDIAQGAVDRVTGIGKLQRMVYVGHRISPAGAATVASGIGLHVESLHIGWQRSECVAYPAAGVASSADVMHPHLVFLIGL